MTAGQTERIAATVTQEPHPIVEVKEVERHFGTVHALGPVNLTIGAGEFVSIVGPSGCGKSTLLELIAGLQDTDAGRIEIAGSVVNGPRPSTSVIFQESATLPWRTVLDNVAFALEARGVKKAERLRLAGLLLDRVGLAQFAGHYPSQLSGGMRQRVAIARCLSTNPELILADEPFGALDEQTRLLMSFELLTLVDQLSCGVLFITHSIQEAVLLSDRVVVMSARPGKILDEIAIDLPRPRTEHVLAEPAAVAVIDRIWSKLRAEASAAMLGTP